ncbi:MAG: serine/threonine-protein kinase, partial [Chloroflexota bacterium]
TAFIGAGGMACVYRAKEEGTPHEFALKFLKDEYHNLDYLVEYFEEEASSMQTLAHPNIVRFYRFVKHPSYSYIIMDFVDGFALSEVLKLAQKKNTPMPLDEVVRVFVQMARALDTIHRDDFVHRDIKPSNVLIDRKTGQTFLTDLGITSAAGTYIEGAGTIAYMSPEQAETWTADHRSDIYACGILLYEMLTGKRPFNPEPGLTTAEREADLLRKHKEMPIPNITRSRGDLPKALNEILDKAMAKHPDDRYQSVITFARDVHEALRPKLSSDLQEFASLQHRQIAAPPTANSTDADSQNMLRLALMVGIAAIILGGLLVFGVFSDGANLFSNNTATPTSTASSTPTQTPLPTMTPTANPVEAVDISYPFLSGVDAIAEPDSLDTLLINASDEEPFEFLRVGSVNGFQVTFDIASVDTTSRYGVAFRMVDSANYHAFLLTPETRNWQIIDVADGVETVQVNGTLETLPTQLTISGIGDFFEIRTDETRISYESALYPQGSIALYLETGSLQLDSLTLSLLADEAQVALTMTPTPSIGLASPLRFIRADVVAMIDTNNQRDRTVDCPNYISLYESLTRHLDSDNANVRDFATRAQTVGTRVYQRCLLDSPDDILQEITHLQ